MKKLFLLVCFSCLSLLRAQNLLNGLQACYPLDCNGFNSVSANSAITANFVAGVICSTGHSGVPNTCAEFPSGAWGSIAINNTAVIGNQFVCISGWYYIGSNVNSNLAYKNNGALPWNNALFSLHIQPSVNGPCIQLDRTGGTYATPIPYSLTTPAVTIGWHHIVFCISTTAINLWVDATPYSLSTVNSALLFSSGHPIIFGNNPIGGVGVTWYDGKIDNIRIYDRQLTNAEVIDLYSNDPTCASSGTPPSPPPPPPGNYCSGSQASLIGDYEVPLGGYSYNFTTPQNTAGKVIIGKTNCVSFGSRLSVEDDFIGTGITSNCSTVGGNNIAIRGTGGNSNSSSASNIFGVLGVSKLSSSNLTGNAAGVAGFCGGMSPALMPPGENIGVYGNSLANNGIWAGYFDGDVNINGNVRILSSWVFSDKRFKRDIKGLENVGEKLMKLNGYSYFFRKGEFPLKNFDENRHIGLIAQEVREVFPELVKEGRDGYLGVDYQGLVPVLIEAFKNQQQQINELKATMQSFVANTSPDKIKGSTNSVELSDKNAIVLDQNVPNPFAESTVITYNLPQTYTKAQIIFSNADGKLIKVVDLSEKGPGSLNVFANDLTHGVYTYSLVVDGKTIDTKKMIKE